MSPLSVSRLFPIVAMAALLNGCTASSSGTAPMVDAGVAPSLSVRDVTIGLQRDPALSQLMAQISAARIRDTDSILVSFGTRHTMADTLSATRGIGASRRFLHQRLAGYSAECGGCLRVEYNPELVEVARHPQKPMVNIVNVLAWLPGRDTSRVVVIGGHYDSCVCNVDRFDFTSDAPGADDDGSGTAAVVELARVFSRAYPRGLDATVVFALYSGEELGLLGSTHFARSLHARNLRVVAAMTDDIIGNVVADDGQVDSTSVRIFGADPDNGPSRELARYAWAVGTLYNPAFAVFPVFRLDRVGRGGDHSPFVSLRDAGLRFTERLENYKRQHLPTDLLKDVNFGYVANVARLNAAVVGALASAPPVPDSVTVRRDQSSGGQKWLLSWRPVASAASYEIVVRRTTSPTHDQVIPVGNVGSYLLPFQLDDMWAGVRSVGANGHRSIAVVVPSPVFVTR